jgi:hypothetical protein
MIVMPRQMSQRRPSSGSRDLAAMMMFDLDRETM